MAARAFSPPIRLAASIASAATSASGFGVVGAQPVDYVDLRGVVQTGQRGGYRGVGLVVGERLGSAHRAVTVLAAFIRQSLDNERSHGFAFELHQQVETRQTHVALVELHHLLGGTLHCLGAVLHQVAVEQDEVCAVSVGGLEGVARSLGGRAQNLGRLLAAAQGERIIYMYRLLGSSGFRPLDENILRAVEMGFVRSDLRQQGLAQAVGVLVLHELQHRVLGAADRRQRARREVAQIVVAEQTREERGVVSRGALLQHRHQERFVGVVARLGHGGLQAFAHAAAQRFVVFRHVCRDAVEGVLYGRVFDAFGRGLEHGAEHLDALAARGGQFAHDLIVVVGRLGRQLSQRVGDDGRGDAASRILSMNGREGHRCREGQYDE